EDAGVILDVIALDRHRLDAAGLGRSHDRERDDQCRGQSEGKLEPAIRHWRSLLGLDADRSEATMQFEPEVPWVATTRFQSRRHLLSYLRTFKARQRLHLVRVMEQKIGPGQSSVLEGPG